MKKGSPEAKAWGKKMQRMRKSEKSRSRTARTRGKNMAKRGGSAVRRRATKRLNVKKNDIKMGAVGILGLVIGYELAKRL